MGGYRAGTQTMNKVIPSIQKLGETMKLGAENAGNPLNPVWPVKGAKAAGISKLAGLLGTGAKLAGPVAAGMTLFDLIQTLGPRINMSKMASSDAADIPPAATGASPVSDEEKLRELMATIGPSRDH
jgi:hypothetical protein